MCLCLVQTADGANVKLPLKDMSYRAFLKKRIAGGALLWCSAQRFINSVSFFCECTSEERHSNCFLVCDPKYLHMHFRKTNFKMWEMSFRRNFKGCKSR